MLRDLGATSLLLSTDPHQPTTFQKKPATISDVVERQQDHREASVHGTKSEAHDSQE